MKNQEDAYGQELLAHLNGEETYEIIERDDSYIGLSGGCPVYFAPFEEWIDIEKQAVGLAHGKVLDIGAGAGRVALYLQGIGLETVAIDNSPLAIQVCSRRGVRDARVLPIEDIKDISKECFDTVVMFGNNFGLFGSREGTVRLLRQLHAMTSENAVILAESYDIYQTEDELHLAYHKKNRKNGKMSGQVTIRVRYRHYVGQWFDYLMVSPDEMRDIVGGTGWKVREFLMSDTAGYIGVLEKE